MPPLARPDLAHLPESQALAQYAAVALFLHRAQAVKPDFQVTPANARAIAEICTRLDGLPLALELAAPRLTLLSPQALRTRLDHQLAVLTAGARDLPERQRTLRRTLAWSYDLLHAQEQRLFRRRAVFVDGCTLAAAEAVCPAPDHAGTNVFELVTALMDNSLVQQRAQAHEEPRLLVLETVQEYAWEALAADEEVEAVRQAHAAYYLALAEQALWLQRLERDQGNLRAAQQWLLAGHTPEKKEMALRLASALARFWEVSPRLQEGWTFLELALVDSEETVPPAVRAKALATAVFVALNQADSDRAEALRAQSLALYHQLGDKGGIGTALQRLGMIARTKGNVAAARSLLEEALAMPGSTMPRFA